MIKKLITICCVLCMFITTISCVNLHPLMAESSDMQTNSKSAVLMDYYSGEIIYEKDAQAKMPVASIVKLMTSLLVLEKIENGEISLQDKVTTTENASSMGGSQIFIDPYSQYTVEELLKGIIISSANDASVALAEHVAGSEKAFVKLMNSKAKELGLNNTLYSNCTGLSEAEQYSSAEDTARLIKEVHKYKLYTQYSTIWMENMKHPSGRITELVNTNKLIRYYQGCDIGKTGFTDEAGYCLGASAQKNEMRFVAVVLGTKDKQERFNEVAKLLSYGFANYTNKLVVDSNVPIKTIEVKAGKVSTIEVFAKEDFIALQRKGNDSNYDISVDIKDSIKAPANHGDVVGEIVISKDGKVIKIINAIIKENLEKLTLQDTFNKVISNW